MIDMQKTSHFINVTLPSFIFSKQSDSRRLFDPIISTHTKIKCIHEPTVTTKRQSECKASDSATGLNTGASWATASNSQQIRHLHVSVDGTGLIIRK